MDVSFNLDDIDSDSTDYEPVGVQNANGTFARCKTEDENTGLPWE